MNKPNIILIMCDDLGYGDTGFNGNEVIQTPHLDTLRAEGARFTRFYAGGPVCSPTRGTCLTGRHYARYGVTHANAGRLPHQEITVAQVCKSQGYRTGHFGKWHLGTLTTTERDSNRGSPDRPELYSPPWDRDFDVCFSTEAKVPTWDPMLVPDEGGPGGHRWGEPGSPFGTYYWNDAGEKVTDNLEGDDSRVIVDRAIPFIRDSVQRKLPFLTVVWFHTPHTPVVAGPEYRARYADHCEDEQHYYGCVTAMDEQVGRLNSLVKELGVEHDTMIWFCSDNGPEGSDSLESNGRNRGTTGGLRGRKRSLFNGGVGVPALVKWPALVRPGMEFTVPCSTLDYFPTVCEQLGFRLLDPRPIDGTSLMPLLRGEMTERPKPIPYRFRDPRRAMAGSPTFAMTDNRYKFLTNFSEDGAEELVFDLIEDPYEQHNIIGQQREFADAMREELRGLVTDFRRSHLGGDYNDPSYKPVNAFQEIWETWTDA